MRPLWRQRFGVTIGTLALAALAMNACGRGAATAPAAEPTAPAPTAAPAAPAARPTAPPPVADQLFVRDGRDGARPTLRVLGGAARPAPMPLGAASADWSQ